MRKFTFSQIFNTVSLLFVLCILVCIIALSETLVSDSNNMRQTEEIQFSDKTTTILYFPGFLSGDYEQTEAKRILTNIFSSETPNVYHAPWCKSKEPQDVPEQWKEEIQNAEQTALKWANKIEQLNDKQRQHLILVGHSLGGRVVIRILHQLNSNHKTIQQAILIGAAIDYDDSQIPTALNASQKRVISVVNPYDLALNLYHRLGSENRHVALGTGYKDFLPDTLCEILTETSTNHESVFYLAQLQQKIKNNQNAIIVPQENYNNPIFWNRPKNKSWKIVESYKQWELYTSNNQKRYMIVDPLSFIRASGSKEAITQSFLKVKKQLDANIIDIDGKIVQDFPKIDVQTYQPIQQQKGSSIELYWTDYKRPFRGWRMQKYEPSNGKKTFRILDPASNVRSIGTEAQIRHEFENILQQLD